jgi:hypothetical protein
VPAAEAPELETVNLQLHPLPADEAPAVATDDPVARVLADARLSDGAALLDALEARRVELGLSNAAPEAAAIPPLCIGHATKTLGPSRQKSPTLATLDRLMAVLGLSFVLVRDPEKIDRVRSRWVPRHMEKVRQRALSLTTIARAKPHVLAALLRRARHPRWKDVPAPAFLQAMAQED